MAKNYVQMIPRAEIDAATLLLLLDSPFYAGGLPEACSDIYITNSSNVDVNLSFDGGITTHEIVRVGERLIFMSQINSRPNNYVCLFRKGSRITINGAPGIGNIYLSGSYQN